MPVPQNKRVILGWVAFGAGFAVAGGFIAFISLIGIVTRLAGLTKTADAIPTYENSMALGLIFFNLVSLYQPDLQWISYTAALSIINIVGLFTGIFAGCLAGALAPRPQIWTMGFRCFVSFANSTNQDFCQKLLLNL